MLLQALFVISAGFSHTALRQPCASAACQQLKLRSCASADADKRRLIGRRLGGRAVNKMAAKPLASEVKGAARAKQVGQEGGEEEKTLSCRLGIDAGMLRASQDASDVLVNSLEDALKDASQKLKEDASQAAKEGTKFFIAGVNARALFIAGATIFTASVLVHPSNNVRSLVVGCLGVAFMARGIYDGA